MYMQNISLILDFGGGRVSEITVPADITMYQLMRYLLDRFSFLQESQYDNTFPYIIKDCEFDEIINRYKDRCSKLADFLDGNTRISITQRIPYDNDSYSCLEGNLVCPETNPDDRIPSPFVTTQPMMSWGDDDDDFSYPQKKMI